MDNIDRKDSCDSSRRGFLKALGIGAMAMSLDGKQMFAADTPGRKPNVVFIISDDLNVALSGFGHPQCKTPELDALAKRGVRFDNMHCQYPVCGASRASIMSGQYPYTNGTMGNVGTLRDNSPDIITMSQIFKHNGYHTGRVSKIYHMGIPREIIAGTSERDDSLSWNEAINIKAPEHHTKGIKNYWSPGDTTSQTFQSVAIPGGDSEQADGMAADHAIQFLDQNKDKPFFLALGLVRPHVPLVAPRKYFDIYEHTDMLVPQVPANDLDDVPEIIRGYKNNDRYGVTAELHQGLLKSYYASVSYMDAQAGRVLKHLDSLGLSDNTIVVFTSDHGYLLGHHHKYQKQHLFEEATRVPFIISVPWLKGEHGKKTGKITELIDLFPTLAELAQLPAPGTLQGTSMKTLLEDVDSSRWSKQEAFTVSRSGGESIRTDTWRFTQWGFGEKGCELYDLSKDPGEFKNLANNPEYAAQLKSMKAQLQKKRLDAGYAMYQKQLKNKQKN
ncbi:sulfatase [Candidatus Latescibacterota bacterium]